MGSLGSLNIRVDKLPKEKFVKGKDGAVYCDITFSINDDTRYGNNVSAMVKQTKEERDAKKAKEYIGNGKIFWTDGTIKLADKDELAKNLNSSPYENKAEDSGLPF